MAIRTAEFAKEVNGSAGGGLIGGEERGVVDGAVVMDLAPPAIMETENACGADGKIEGLAAGGEMAAFPADGVEEFAGLVERVIEEFDVDSSGALENASVDRADVLPAALDTANGVVERSVSGVIPILLHEREIASVEGTIELRESVKRCSRIGD